MNYAIKIMKQSEGSYLFTIPDMPGCSTTAKTLETGMDNLKQAVSDHLTILSEYGEDIPRAKTIDRYISNQGLEPNCIWALLDIDIVPFLGKSQKINVTLPELLIKKIDDRVSKTAEHKTRSGFIAHSCLKALEE